MIRKILILFVGLMLGVCAASAQSLAAYRERLAEPVACAESNLQAAVTVTERGEAADAVSRAAHENARLRFKGYRVCIFFDNGANARSGAQSAQATFATTYPEIKSYIAYNSPYFTVTVGDCVTTEEAIILMGRIKSTFPKAFLKNEDLSVADLLK